MIFLVQPIAPILGTITNIPSLLTFLTKMIFHFSPFGGICHFTRGYHELIGIRNERRACIAARMSANIFAVGSALGAKKLHVDQENDNQEDQCRIQYI